MKIIDERNAKNNQRNANKDRKKQGEQNPQ